MHVIELRRTRGASLTLASFALSALMTLSAASSFAQSEDVRAAMGRSAVTPVPESEAETAKATAIFAEYWTWLLQQFPEQATTQGHHEYDAQVTDLSAEAVLRRKKYRVDLRQRLRALQAPLLGETDRTSAAMLTYDLDQAIALDTLFGRLPFGAEASPTPVTQESGPQLELPYLIQATRFTTVADYENYIARLSKMRVQMNQRIEAMREGIRSGWTAPKVAIAAVPHQIDDLVAADIDQHPAFAPFLKFGPAISAVDQRRLTAQARKAVGDDVIPAFRALQTFFVQTYLPAARATLAASASPGGPAYYQLLLNQNTTTLMTPEIIRDLGLAEVARIEESMAQTQSATGFTGTRQEFARFMREDPRFFYTRAEDMLAGYRDIAKRADAQLPALFAVLPRQTYGVRAMLPSEGDASEHYTEGASDNSRPGYFDANTNDLTTRPKWEMETLLLHEAVPGHHLQGARAQEMEDLPEFRRVAWYTAYGEGWALYAESLGYEMGFYKDPYMRYGNLTDEMLRASRLVIDTGIHAFGWSREQAIQYLLDHTPMARAAVEAEIDRYIVLPGQATAYKIGQIKIRSLRTRAEQALGPKFDVRRFHNLIIDAGVLPLDMLDTRVNDWIAREKAT